MWHEFFKPSRVLFALVALALVALLITRPALVDVSQPKPKQAPKVDVETLNGVDLSHYQSEVDWAKAHGAGISFAYSKATEGGSYVDKSYASHRAGAAKQGVIFGAYHFYRPNVDPIAQAKHFLDVAKVAQGDLPPALDLEIAPNSDEASAYKADVLKWLAHVEKATGCKPIVYASPSFWRTHLGSELADYPFWLAEYSRTPKPPKTAAAWTIWQHTEKGSVVGIKGLVDLDVAASKDALVNSICGAK